MTDRYRPSPEQINTLAQRLRVYNFSPHSNEAMARYAVSNHAMQSIIHAAQAEAWDAGKEAGVEETYFELRGSPTDSDAHLFPLANPYKESADV